MEDSPASKDIEFNKSSVAPNDHVLPQNDDVIISVPSSSTLSVDQSSGTVKIDGDTSKSEQFYDKDIEVKRSGEVKEDVLSQIDDLVIAFSTSFTLSDDPCSGPGNDTSFEQLGTVEAGVYKLTSGREESAMEDIGVKSSSSANDSVLSQSDDPQVDTSFEQSGTVETSVDKLISGQTEETVMEDIEVKSSGTANDNIFSQSDDLKVDTSFEQLGTTETGVDESTSGQIEETATEDIEMKSSGSANDNILSQSDDLKVDTSFEQLGTIETGVDESTSGRIEESAVEDIVVKRSGSANDCVLSESDDVQIGTSFELLRTVAIDLDKLTIGQIEESSVEVIEAKRSGPDTDSDLCQSDDLQIDSSFEQSGPAENVDKSTSEHKQNTLKDIEVKRSGTANDRVLSQSDDLQIDASPELSGTVEIDVDKSTSEHIEESAVKSIEVRRSGTANDVVLSQSEGYPFTQIDASPEQLGTVEIDVDKSTSGQIEESAVKDIGVKISSASIDGLYQSNDLLIDPSLEQLGTVDVEVKRSGTANDCVLSQSDDLQIDASPALSGTVEIDVDKSTSEHIEESAVKSIEVKRSGTANDVVLSQSEELQIDASPEQLGTVEIDVDKSTSGQIEESDVKDIGVKISGASIDGLYQSNDLLIDPSLEQLGTVEVDVDKSTSAQAEENDVNDVEVKRSGATNVVMLPQSDDLLIAVSTSFVLANVHYSGPGSGTCFEQLGTVDTDVDKLISDQLEESDMKDIEVNRPGAINNSVLSPNDDLIAVSSSFILTDDCSSGLGNVTSCEQLGTVEIDVDKSTCEQIEKCASNDDLLSQSDDLLVAASSSSMLGDDRSSGLGSDAYFEQVGTVEAHVGNTTSDCIEEMPKMVKTSEPVKSGKNAKFNLRKSLAWDSAFFTSDGVLDADELLTMIDRGEKGVKHQLPGIEEEVYRSMDSISTLESDNLSLECLEAELFEDIRASIQKSSRASNPISSSIKVSPGNGYSHPKVSSSSKKVDLDSGKRPVARFKDDGSKIPQPKIITRVNSTSTLTKRALSTNVAKKDHDILKQAHVTQKGTLAAKTTQGPKVTGVIGPRRGVPKALPSSKPSSLGSKTEPTRPSSSCSNSSSCSSGTDVKTSVDLSRKKVEPKTGKLTAGSVPQTSSRISTKTKAPAPANSRLPSRFVSSKLSSRIPSASSASECSSESTSSTSTINRRSTSRGSIDTLVSYRSSVESASSIHSTDQNSNQNGNQAEVVPPSQTGSLSRPPSAQPTGLRMPSPKIGWFDGGKSGVRTPTGGIQSQAGLPTGPTNSNSVKGVKLPQSKTASAHTNLKPNKHSNLGNKLSCKTNTPGNDHLEMSSEVHSLVAGKDNKVDKSSSRTPFAVKNSVHDI